MPQSNDSNSSSELRNYILKVFVILAIIGAIVSGAVAIFTTSRPETVDSAAESVVPGINPSGFQGPSTPPSGNGPTSPPPGM